MKDSLANNRQTGNALIALLVFMVIALSIVTLSASLFIDINQREQAANQAAQAFSLAESGAENAILRLLRDPGYTGETLPVGNDQAIIDVTGSDPIQITSRGESGEFARVVTVELSRVNGALQVVSWLETAN